MNRKKQILLLLVTIVLGILLVCVKLTGPVWHCIIGIMIVIISVKHICIRMVKMKKMSKSQRRIDSVLLLSLIIMAGTGLLMNPLERMLLIKIIHKISGIVFFIGIIIHVVQHKKDSGVKSHLQK